MSFPWTLVGSMLLGIWLMLAPAIFGISIETTVADVNHLGGSLIVVVSVICMGEVVRRGRYLNVLLGLGVAGAPWLLSDSTMAFNLSGTISGLAVAVLALPCGIKTETYGSWDRYVK